MPLPRPRSPLRVALRSTLPLRSTLRRALRTALRAAPLALAAALTLATGPGCPAKLDEAAIRARETAELEARISGPKVMLYRAAKTAVRSAPPREEMRALAPTPPGLEEWRAVFESRPALAPHRKRVGLVLAGCALREHAWTTAGPALEGLVRAWESPRGSATGTATTLYPDAGSGGAPATTSPTSLYPLVPFTGPADLLAQCEDILHEDEDRFPTLALALLPEARRRDALARRAPFDAPPLDRITAPAFEHLCLGAAWLLLAPDLALYEAWRADAAALGPIDAAALHALRARLAKQHKWTYRALDELAALEARLPAVRAAATALAGEAAADEVLGLFQGLLHLLRYECYTLLDRPEDAKRSLAALEASVQGKRGLGAAAHLLAASSLLDRRDLAGARKEIELAIAALPPEDKVVPELKAALAKLSEIEASTLLPAALREHVESLLGQGLLRASLGKGALGWTEGFRERTGAEISSWEAQLPGKAETETRLRLLWERTRAAVASGTAR